MLEVADCWKCCWYGSVEADSEAGDWKRSAWAWCEVMGKAEEAGGGGGKYGGWNSVMTLVTA